MTHPNWFRKDESGSLFRIMQRTCLDSGPVGGFLSLQQSSTLWLDDRGLLKSTEEMSQWRTLGILAHPPTPRLLICCEQSPAQRHRASLWPPDAPFSGETEENDSASVSGCVRLVQRDTTPTKAICLKTSAMWGPKSLIVTDWSEPLL